jgi:hypothetical protein
MTAELHSCRAVPKPATFVYSFRKEFAPAILSGAKSQTIRQVRKDGRRPRPGDLIRFFTGMRTAYCRKLGSSIVTDCFTVYMDLEDLSARVIVLGGARLNFTDMEAFARLDGFDSAFAMLGWFQDAYRQSDTPVTGFNGFCVRWRPLRPAGTRRRLRSVP